MIKWEYAQVFSPTEKELKAYGQDNWELVAIDNVMTSESYDGQITSIDTSSEYTFKRPLE